MERRNRPLNVVDRSLAKGKGEVSLSAIAFLLSELVQYTQGRVDTAAELEQRLEDAGYGIGLRLLELTSIRDRGSRRETKMIEMLKFISSNLWKTLFGHAADGLEKSVENDDEYMINDSDAKLSRYVSVPPSMGSINTDAFVAGILRGVLETAEFPCRVSAHFVEGENGGPGRQIFLIKFSAEVMVRERRVS